MARQYEYDFNYVVGYDPDLVPERPVTVVFLVVNSDRENQYLQSKKKLALLDWLPTKLSLKSHSFSWALEQVMARLSALVLADMFDVGVGPLCSLGYDIEDFSIGQIESAR